MNKKGFEINALMWLLFILALLLILIAIIGSNKNMMGDITSKLLDVMRFK